MSINNSKVTKSTDMDTNPNFLDLLINYKYTKWIFRLPIIGKILKKDFVRTIFDHPFVKKFANREMIMYIIFGVLATVVNLGTFWLLRIVLGINLNVSNFLAVASSVLFAYFTNKLWVFRSNTNGISALLKEFSKFILARSVTAVLELVGVPFLVYISVNFNVIKNPDTAEMLAKISLTVFIVVTNYYLSKKAIFKDTK